MKNILIIKMSSLGDIIQAFPVLDYIHQCYPNVKIDWVVEKPFAELLEAHPLIHQVFVTQTKKWRSSFWKKSIRKEIKQFRHLLQQTSYDLVIDLQGNIKSGFVTFLAKALSKVGFGYQTAPEWPNILTTQQRYNPPKGKNIRDDYLFIVKQALKSQQTFLEKGSSLRLTVNEIHQLRPYQEFIQKNQYFNILICPGSNWTNKQLSKETLKDFLNRISDHFNVHFLFVWGNLSEKILVEELAATIPLQSSLLPRLSLPVLQNLIKEVDLVIAMDSLPLHLAGTTKTPTYSVFGPSSANKYSPKGQQHQNFQGVCPYGQQFEKRCHILRTCKTGACIKDLEGQLLFNHFHDWWLSLETISELK